VRKSKTVCKSWW